MTEIELAAEKVRRWNAVLYASRGVPVPRPGVWLVLTHCPHCARFRRYCEFHRGKARPNPQPIG